jgi:hypothetical protein
VDYCYENATLRKKQTKFLHISLRVVKRFEMFFLLVGFYETFVSTSVSVRWNFSMGLQTQNNNSWNLSINPLKAIKSHS